MEDNTSERRRNAQKILFYISLKRRIHKPEQTDTPRHEHISATYQPAREGRAGDV